MYFSSSSQAQDAVITFGAAVAALALLPTTSAHGHVSAIVAGGKTYIGSDPNWWYQPAGQVVPTAGWFALNQDNGFVSPSAFSTVDIACHKSAKSGNQQIPVTAGSTITLQWNTWPISHHGPVIDYLAKCPGNCTALTDASSLSFTKIDAVGLIDDTTPPGTWASDSIANSPTFSYPVKIPASIANGNYVLRHEILALHSAGSNNGAQSYPQCINLQVTGGGSTVLSGVKATTFYTATDPGILISIYSKITNYVIPGPALSNIKKMARHVRDFALEA